MKKFSFDFVKSLIEIVDIKVTDLERASMVYGFDIPIDFNIRKYIENNKDLANFSIEKLIKHWLHYGKHENRIYK